MIIFTFFLLGAAVMVALGIKHDEPMMIGIGCLAGIYTAYSYGRFVETARAMSYIKRMKEAKDE